jgi:cytochrome c biogenesis protein CcdA
MLNKASSLARALSIILAVVAGFVALGGLNTALALVALGLISGVSMPTERMMGVGVSVLVLPAIGAALGNLPAIGAQLNAVAGNVALTAAAALGAAMALYLFNMVKDDLMGLTAK